ncbi:FtsK/SpoIIIE domain-containing protein [Alkalicoccobacillus gibsonii]|uniref:FtsK/SpoIIIE domain-containing protein n=1 Tax=Alkalicoccobacillus gibsonii TaxID=79881 RepID=UPI003F7C4CAF
MEKIISLTSNYPDWNKRMRNIHLVSISLFLVLMTTITISSENEFVQIVFSILTVFLLFKINKWFNIKRNKVKSKYYWQNKLLYFISSNSLYKEDYEIYFETDKNGNEKEKKRKFISNSAEFGYEKTSDKIIILALKNGDSYSDKITKLDVELSALLNLPLEEKIDRPSICEYHYYLKRPKRLNLTSSSFEEVSDNQTIQLGYGVEYNPENTPHILISGGTGSGKSIFISFLLLEFLKRKTTVYICDPKHSDLFSLSNYLGEEKVATSPNNIARVVRLAVNEMKERYEYMNANFKYGSNFVDHGFKPVWVIFDEMGAFQASGTDKMSKNIINEVMEGIKQIILLGRQSGVFILVAAQQMNSNTLNTDLRDNLGLRISLGSNSAEGFRMVMGSATPESIPPIEVKGSGLLFKQGSGKESAQYWESPFVDMGKFDFITELKKYL